MVTLTVEQARTLLEAARPRPWLHALILLGVATGAVTVSTTITGDALCQATDKTYRLDTG